MTAIHVFLLLMGMALSSAYAAELPPVKLDTGKLSPGLLVKFPINKLPVFVLQRRPNELTVLRQIHINDKVAVVGCAKCDPVLRSISPDYLVIWGYNPSSGCELIYVSSTATDWVGHPVHGQGGFVDKCSATEYDLSGRKLSGPKTSPNKLMVPPYTHNKGVIEIEANATPTL